MPFTLPELPYRQGRARPAMSAETLEFHHGKHHKAYVDKTNELVAASSRWRAPRWPRSSAPPSSEGNAKLFNNSAQLWNHSFFWQCLAPAEGQQPDGKLPS